ncbi:fluoride efflux transporter CrcB [Xanthomonadaceae bacterium XH05]|nr:fluoride efflux transporter CrcB [Xanthomonadaceae bacterium XH05]
MTLVPMWQQVLLVALGGAVGSVGRFLVAAWMVRMAGSAFPWGTLAVNLVGSFLAGLLFVWLDGRGDSANWWRALLMVGVLGGFTTWSAFALEVMLLGRDATPGWAGAYVVASLVGGVLLVWAGWRTGVILRG